VGNLYNFKFLISDVKIRPRKLLAVALIIGGTLAWWITITENFPKIFEMVVGQQLWIYVSEAVFLGSGAITAIIGSALSDRINRRKLLIYWISLGVLSTAALAFFTGTLFSLVISVLLGISIGLGFPSCIAMLPDLTLVEERGRVSGFIIFSSFVLILIAFVFVTEFNLGINGTILFALILRSTSFLALGLDPCSREKEAAKPWLSVLASREFALYLVPWTVFNVAGELVSAVWRSLPQTPIYAAALSTGYDLRWFGVAVFGIIAGFSADRLGRKAPFIAALVLMGVSFVLIGFDTSPISVIAYFAISGMSWSFLMVIYLAVIGDVAISGSKEKFCAFVIFIPLLAYMAVRGIVPSISTWIPAANTLSPVLSIIVFASIIPVFVAKETLSAKKIRERRMKEYLEKVGKLVIESRKSAKAQ
jgi:MFS family permease